jgi:predicted  nucleic acid-binding Zn-ribbon protein
MSEPMRETAAARIRAAEAKVQERAEAQPVGEQLAQENERLRARIAALEEELVETQARANAAVAKWQERVYWLDRWHLDLNALMRRPGASEFRAGLRAVRAVGRAFTRAKRRLKRS